MHLSASTEQTLTNVCFLERTMGSYKRGEKEERNKKQVKENFSQEFSDLCPKNWIQVLAVHWLCDLGYVTRSLWASGQVHAPRGGPTEAG